jgi:hypothetical protein
MRVDKLESEKRDDLHHLDDDDLAVVTGGDKIVMCEIAGPAGNFLPMTKQQCEAYDDNFGKW